MIMTMTTTMPTPGPPRDHATPLALRRRLEAGERDYHTIDLVRSVPHIRLPSIDIMRRASASSLSALLVALAATPAAVAFLSPPTSVDDRLRSRRPLAAQVQESYYAAAGAPAVDMDGYNLPLERCVEQWTAVVQAKTSMQAEGIYLRAKDEEDLFVDTLQFAVRREGGLGLVLTEIAGGREDGIGITVIEEIVEGGNADGTGLAPGDSISAASLTKIVEGGANAREERTDASAECLGYDATVAALGSLPPPASSSEEVALTVKRLRRQPRVRVTLRYPPATGAPDATLELFAGENLRRAMLTRGIKLNDKLAERFDSGGTGDCGSDGTCATCVVGVTRGKELLNPMGQQEGQILAKKPRWRMACKAVVGHGMREGEMTIQVNPRQWDTPTGPPL
ncbi:hypothetical protein ACHAWF_018427 [Thalassiosira exigua]